MKKINLNFDLTGLDGVPVGNAGKLVANILVGGSKGDILKYYDWAVALHKGNEITVDASDLKKIKEFIETHDGLTILAKAQILNKLG